MSAYHPYKLGESSTSGPASNASEDGGPAIAVSRTHVKATKRIRGEIACAECRRLKIRCDKMVPCSTCIKRGCGSLCPMCKNEDAEEGSPRLPPDSQESEEPPSAPSADNTLTDSLGVLHIDEDGGSRFFGPSAGSERTPAESRSTAEFDTSYLPAEINMCCRSFPFTPQNVPVQSVQTSIEGLLPPIERAFQLVDTMLEHLSWMFHIVSRQEMRQLINIIYRDRDVEYGPHDLALMLIVISVGAMVDLDLPPYNTEAQHYYKLAQAALALQPILMEESFVSVKVLHFMSVYNGLSGKEENLETSFALLSLASQVALRIDVDPTMWGFQGKEAYDRRVYFWNLVAGSLWQSLVTGRPPIIISSFIDCKIPTPEEENAFQQGEVPLGFGIWGFRFSDLLLQVVQATLSAKPPSLEHVLELDQKVRDFGLANPTNPTIEDTTALSMRNFVRSHYKELILLYLHRAFFTQAMTEYPADPCQSACIVLEDTRPALCARIWRIWSLAFTAAVVVGTVAIRGAHLNLQPLPLEQFETAFRVFKSAAQISSRAARALRPPPIDDMPVFDSSDIIVPQKPFIPPPAPAPAPLLGNTNVTPPSLLLGEYTSGPSTQRFANFAQPPPLRTSTVLPPLSSFHATDHLTTFADLSHGWDGMFHETSAPYSSAMYSSMPAQATNNVGMNVMGNQMLDDRWLYFMNNYDILSDPRLSTS
ncbi:hypothetical protein BDZ89DRAFT_1062420 [Hymenopellis radicata]|nr:hypothetical protein BDZ89DRAFT_1062420 [Hymenopellis radicata]